jgi:hypothetical protein
LQFSSIKSKKKEKIVVGLLDFSPKQTKSRSCVIDDNISYYLYKNKNKKNGK